jgi:hypothetical protein
MSTTTPLLQRITRFTLPTLPARKASLLTAPGPASATVLWLQRPVKEYHRVDQSLPAQFRVPDARSLLPYEIRRRDHANICTTIA